MYGGTSSPIFDVPEFPTLRRIKPLPKRRRTTGPDVGPLGETPAPLPSQNSAGTDLLSQQTSTPPPPPLDPLIPPGIAEELLSRVDSLSTRMALQNYYLPILGNVQNFLASHGVSAANGDGATTAASAAAAALAAVAGGGRSGSLPIPPLADIDSIEFGVHFAAAAAAAAAAGLPMGGLGSFGMGLRDINVHIGPAGATGDDGRADTTSIDAMNPSLLHDGAGPGDYGSNLEGREEGSFREEDHTCHVRQPGNAKKRKVPANVSGSPRGVGNAGEGGSPSSSYLDEDGLDSLPGVDRGFRSREVNLSKEQDADRDRDYDSTPPPVFPPPSFPGQLSILVQKKGKLTAATLAGLQHKEQLKARKRQLAAVIGALSHGDTLALDQALSFNHPFAGSGGEALKFRKSKRRTIRLARAMTILMERPDRKNRHPDAIPFPESKFAFECPSSTADRLISTKEEITTLRKRFQAELERQAARAAKLALAAGDDGKPLAKAKRERQERERDRAARAARQKKAKSSLETGDQTPELVDSQNVPPATGTEPEVGGKPKSKTSKKKKRAALANASNPHHLRNYVPSRLPHSGPVNGSQVSANNTWPAPVRFLSAEIPPKAPRSNRKADASTPLVQITQPTEEWICAFCEYDLFYGDEAAYRKAVRKRKKILRRRRRAAERAAAAASGGNAIAKTPSPTVDEAYEYDGAARSGINERGNAPPQRNQRWKEAPDKEPTASGS